MDGSYNVCSRLDPRSGIAGAVVAAAKGGAVARFKRDFDYPCHASPCSQRFEEELALLRQTHAQKDAPLKPEAAKGPAQPVQGMGKAQGLPAKPSAQGQPSATAAAAVPAASAAPTQAAARDVQPRNTAAAVPAPRPAVSDNVPRQEGVPRPGEMGAWVWCMGVVSQP